MFIFITVLIVIVALFLIFIVIIQNSKGGGLAAGFASSNQVMGVRKTTDFLEKATWYLAGTLVVLCVGASFFLPKKGSGDIDLRDHIQNVVPAADPNSVAPFGTAIPMDEEPEQEAPVAE